MNLQVTTLNPKAQHLVLAHIAEEPCKIIQIVRVDEGGVALQLVGFKLWVHFGFGFRICFKRLFSCPPLFKDSRLGLRA